MGYTTEFLGAINVVPPLNAKEVEFLEKFAGTRRMLCEQGPYYVDRQGDYGQGSEGVIDFNSPPRGQPGLWCQWLPTDDGSALVWDGNEKFYSSAEWMSYLISEFLAPGAPAKSELNFLEDHVCNGTILAQGEEIEDRWKLVVVNNQVLSINLE